MRVFDFPQGSEAWHMARLGIPTASCFGKIVTPAGALSKQSDTYLHQLVAERLLGRPVDETDTAWMERGQVMEQEAISYFELQRGVDVRRAGFVTTDDGVAGCSPDGIVGDDAGLELKCPTAATHVGYLLDVEPRKYWPQIQGALWITERARWSFLSYCPGLPPALTDYERDEEYIAKLGPAVREFAARVEEAHGRLAALVGQERRSA